MFRILEGSLIIYDNATGLNTFGWDVNTRKRIYDEIINQQSDKIIDIKE